MSDVMTSRSIPSRGTKYSFCRADADDAGGGLGLLFGLAAIARCVMSEREDIGR